MNGPVASVLGMGLACPLGLRVSPAIAAMRTDMSRFHELPDMQIAGGGIRISALRRRSLDAADRNGRMQFFLRHALDEALGAVSVSAPKIPCLMVLPSLSEGPPVDAPALFVAAERGLARRGLIHMHGVLAVGRAGVFAAVESACGLLQAGTPRVLVAAVDSLVDLATLDALDDANRLVSASNLDGIIPGEGAAAILLGPAHHPHAGPQLCAIASAHEPLPRATVGTRVSGSDGLTSVFSQLRSKFGERRADEVFAGNPAQVFYGREFAHAYLRNAALMPEPLEFRTLGGSLGDVGAASGAIALVQALSECTQHDLPRLHLAFASSEDGLVGGCLVKSLQSRERA